MKVKINKEKIYELISKYEGNYISLVTDVIFNTICMCSDLTDSQIKFPEAEAYIKFIDDTVSHMLNGEVYSPYTDTWYIPETIDTTS